MEQTSIDIELHEIPTPADSSTPNNAQAVNDNVSDCTSTACTDDEAPDYGSPSSSHTHPYVSPFTHFEFSNKYQWRALVSLSCSLLNTSSVRMPAYRRGGGSQRYS